MTEPQLNNFNNICYEDFDIRTHHTEMNINSSPPEEDPPLENPPPIPPKSSLNSSIDFGNSLERPKRSNCDDPDIVTPPENYSHPKLHRDDASSVDEEKNGEFVGRF